MARTSAANLATACGASNNGTSCTGSAASSVSTDFYVTGCSITGITTSINTGLSRTYTVAVSGNAKKDKLLQSANYTVNCNSYCSQSSKSNTSFDILFTNHSGDPQTATFYITWNDAYNGNIGNSTSLNVTVNSD